jgi:DNA recombination protein RmuC
METIILILLIIISISLVFLLIRLSSKKDNTTANAINLQEQIQKFENLSKITMEEFRHSQELRLKAIEDQYERQLQELRIRLENQSREVRRESSNEFQNLAQKILEENSKSLQEANNTNIDHLLTPLKQSIEDFKRSMTDSHVRATASQQSLTDQIERLMQLNISIGEEARNLTSALKGNPKVQGDWGENILFTLLENAGLKKDVNFFVQSSSENGRAIRDEEGNLQRPDFVILLPDEHKIIVDSKVSLTAYCEYMAAENDDDKNKFASRHIISVKKHIDELATKRYQRNITNAADHVLMFIPNEGAYFAAMNIDSNINQYAFERNVVIVAPTHIFSVMQLTAQLWRQEKQSRNSAEIARLAGLLYDKFVRFSDQFIKLDSDIDNMHQSYTSLYDMLVKGPTSLVTRSERLHSLGASTKKRINTRLLAQSGVEEDDEHALYSE